MTPPITMQDLIDAVTPEHMEKVIQSAQEAIGDEQRRKAIDDAREAGLEPEAPQD